MASDGTVHLKFPNDFAKSMVANARMEDSLLAAICMATQRSPADVRLMMGILEGNENISDLDDLEVSEAE